MSTQLLRALLPVMWEEPNPTSCFQEVLVMKYWRGMGEEVKSVSFNLIFLMESVEW